MLWRAISSFFVCIDKFKSVKKNIKVSIFSDNKLDASGLEKDCFRGNYFQRNWVFATHSNFLIHISLQPDGINLGYFKLRISDQT